MKTLSTLTLILNSLFMFSCTHIHSHLKKTTPPQRQQISNDFFNHTAYPQVNATLTPVQKNQTKSIALSLFEWGHRQKYHTFEFSYATAKEINQSETTIKAYYYQPKKKNKKVPLVIIFPILAGDHLVSEWQSKILANYGFAVLRFEKKKGFLNTDVEPSFHASILQQTIIDARRGLDFILKQPEIDNEKIAVTGVSLGAISAQLLMAADERVQLGAFFLIGGNLPKIIATSNEENVVKFRHKILKSIPDTELISYLTPFYQQTDPLQYANLLAPDRILMFSATHDKVILPEISQQMWNQLGQPYWIKVPYVGHYSAVLYFFYGNKKMASFFHHKFHLIENAKKHP